MTDRIIQLIHFLSDVYYDEDMSIDDITSKIITLSPDGVFEQYRYTESIIEYPMNRYYHDGNIDMFIRFITIVKKYLNNVSMNVDYHVFSISIILYEHVTEKYTPNPYVDDYVLYLNSLGIVIDHQSFNILAPDAVALLRL